MNGIELFMVKTIDIDGLCHERYPCKHTCKVTLTDGREKTIKIAGDEIRTLIKAINSGRINNKSSDEHFRKYNPNPAYIRGEPQDILTSIFTNNIVK